MSGTYRKVILALANQPNVQQLVTRHRRFQPLVRRFVAGEHLDDAVRVCQALNTRGYSVTLDYLGEDVQSADDIAKNRDAYQQILQRIVAEHLDATVSLKLTQLGLSSAPSSAETSLRSIVKTAAEYGIFVRVDMEGSAFTQSTFDIVRSVHRELPNVGPVIQAYLRRSVDDVQAAIQEGWRVRLCKGAYAEPPSIAFPQKRDVDRNYVALAQELMQHATYPALATHDWPIIQEALDYLNRCHPNDPRRVEFQMLYGIRRDLQQTLLSLGRPIRIYLPFGAAYFAYFSRRIAERPANLGFVLRSLGGNR